MTTPARRRWLDQNQERIRSQKAAYYQAHKDVIKARARAWEKAHPECRHRDPAQAAAAQARYRANYLERTDRLNREAQARWRARQRAKDPELAARLNREAQARFRARQKGKPSNV